MREITLDLGGEGEMVEISLKLKGSACRAEDFQIALVAFRKQWLQDHKAIMQRDPLKRVKRKPCGCK